MFRRKRMSIKYQMALVCVIMITFTLVMCWLVNNIFLDKFYQRDKKLKVLVAYSLVEEAIYENRLYYEEFKYTLQQIADSENISISLLNQNMNIVYTTENMDDMSILQIQESVYNMFGAISENADIIEATDNYTIAITEDKRFDSDYMQLTAIVDPGYFLVIRSAIQTFEQNADISNTFLAYIGTVIIILSCMAAWIITERITRPINKLVEISDRMAALDFEARYEGDDQNELGILGDRMNFLSDTLESTISDLKTANRDLQTEIDKKVEIDEMRKDFLSNVSHELKTPIALIQGYAEGLKECVNDDDESKDFYCDVIMDEAAKMNTLVQKLLTLNKIEFGDNDVKMERIDLSELLNNVIDSVTLLANQKDATLVRSFENNIFAWGDQFEVQQVITNYLSNAINHVSGEMKIDVKAEKIDNRIKISVFNTGNPIPEDELENIWVKFYKVDKAHTRDYGGTGIGLSIVKAIVESMGQEYGVKNYDNGVEFWFTLDSGN